MRFDDSLDTVLSAEMSTPFGARSAWRQLVDLIGRQRVPADDAAIARLEAIRADVPPPVRAASARALAFAAPPAALVRLFAEDEIAVAAPVLRAADLDGGEWIAMLPAMSSAARSILRHRLDLAPEVRRALDSFGPVDFILPAASPETAPDRAEPSAIDWSKADAAPQPVEPQTIVPLAEPAEPLAEPSPEAAPRFPAETPFVSLASVALGLPVVAEALRRAGEEALTAPPTVEAPETDADPGGFEIADLVARIDAFQRQRSDTPAPASEQSELFELEAVRAETFRFESDATGIVRWIDGAARAPLIGLSLDLAALPSGSRVDGVAAGAFRRRAGFADARLVVDGTSDAAGQWRITGIPVFDRATGRFTGYRGTARRPRADESAAPVRARLGPAADALRQLVHELRTPTNAIAGFAEMIEREMLGPVPDPYRDRAGSIRRQAADLLTAIDDIDLAARIESHALDLRAGQVPVAPLLAQIAGDLAPLATLRGATLVIEPADDLAIAGDDRAVERLLARLTATLVAASARGERIAVSVALADDTIVFGFDRPRALAAYRGDALLAIDAEAEAEAEGAPLLGTGFALRLARNLAVELGGVLTIGATDLTLRLPAAVIPGMEQVSSS